MATDPIPFHVPSLDEEDIPGVLEVLQDRWLTTGPRCRRFEENFASYLAEDSQEELHCIAVNSATAALHLALESIGISPGDKILTTPFTFTATAEVTRYLGADPIFVDVDDSSFNVSAASYERAYAALPKNERSAVKALLPVHYGGLACEMEKLEAFATEAGLRIVDDAAHALPCRHNGKLIGRYGDVSAFSFYATKTLCTGEGGMAVTADGELAQRMRTMRLHGISSDVFDRYRESKPAWYYEVVAPGFKYNMGDMAAALGLSQLRRIDDFRSRRAELAALYTEGLTGIDGVVTPPDAPDGDLHAWHLYALRVSGGQPLRDRFIEELADAGIGTSVHFIPLHLQPFWRERYGLKPEHFPAATSLFGQEVSLPIYPSMTDEQLRRVVRTIPTALERATARANEDRRV